MEVERVKISELTADPANVRKHNEKNMAAIKASLRRFGQQKPVVVDGAGIVRAGNGTLAAAIALGWSHIDIVRTELQGAEATAYAIADNRTAELAEWDADALAQTMAALEIEDEELARDAGFSAEDVAAMALSEKPIHEDEVPEPPATPITKPGDVWLLGKHRVMCGDSAQAADFSRVSQGFAVGAVVTDPPYGIGIDGQKSDMHNKNPKHNRKPHAFMGWDSKRPSPSHMQAILSLSVPTCFFGGNYLADMLPSSRGWIYWSKGQDGLDMSDGELAWTSADKPLRCITVNRAALHGSKHPTQKPVEVMAFAVKYLQPFGGAVYDPFCGSGSTLVACEHLGLECLAMEREPVYCDVIVQRWEKLTGKKAVLESHA